MEKLVEKQSELGKKLQNGLEIVKELGQGKFSNVYLGQSEKGEKFAVKIFKETNKYFDDKANQQRVLLKLKNKHIIPLLQIGENYHIFPLIEGGQLFNYVGKFPENKKQQIARTLFKQLVDALEYMFENKITHRDIKLENILVDREGYLVICDFGFATEIENSNDRVSGSMGTSNYMAPQIFVNQTYSAKSADIFSLGVVLFTLLSGFPPYAQAAVKSDPYYKFFVEQKSNIFWNALKRQFGIPYSDDFINLIDQMLSYDPQERISIQGIKNHRWFQGESLSQKELGDFFKSEP